MSSLHSTVVLVVEDEPLLLMNAAAILEDAGCIVLEAASADAAIAIIEGRADIDVVFTDIEMPGSMDGMRLARAIRDRWPPIKLIVTSGRVSVSEGDLPEGVPFFAKPYQERQLIDAVLA